MLKELAVNYIPIIFYFFLLCSSHQAQSLNLPHKIVRGCLGFGFLAEFIWVLNYLEYCNKTQRTPVVYWDSRSSYYSPEGYNGSLNAWEYYFEPVSKDEYYPGDHIVYDGHFGLNSFFWDYYEYIKNMDLCSPEELKSFKKITHGQFPVYVVYPHGNQHLYNPQLRKYVKKNVLNRYVKIKDTIQQKIDDFITLKMNGKKTIGVHLRGVHSYGEVPEISISDILKEANLHAAPNVQFFVATDQLPLLQQAIKELKGPVVYYECQRFDKTTAPIPGNKLAPRLGEYVLIETMLLSSCDHFIHTISNVSTAVLYFNPKLSHTVLY